MRVFAAHLQRICISCGQCIVAFKDELSVREFMITGFCQACQDDVFDRDWEADEFYDSDIDEAVWSAKRLSSNDRQN